MQKLHHAQGMSKETFLAFVLIGLVLGWISGTLLLTIDILFPGLVFVVLIYIAGKKGGKFLLIFLIPFVFSLIISGVLALLPIERGFKNIQGIIIETKANYFIMSNGIRRYYIYEKTTIREVGDIVSIKGYVSELSFTEYESKFSFEEYLRKMGVKEQINVSSIASIFERPIRLRRKELLFLNNFDPLTKGTIDLLLFAKKDYSNETVALANTIGCLNILSGSGIVYAGFLRFCDKICSYRFKENQTKIIVFILAVFTIPLFLGKIGAYRVLILKSFDVFYVLSKKERSPYLFRLSLAGLILFFLNPFHSLNTGYLLGFGLAFYNFFNSSCLYYFKNKQKKFLKFLSLEYFLLPLFNIRGEFKLLATLFTFIFLPFAYCFSFLSLLSFLSVPYESLLKFCSSFLNKSLVFIDKISLSIPLGDFPKWCVFLFYFAIFLALYFYDLGLTHFSKISAFVQICSLLVPSLPVMAPYIQQVSFINVGQGDAILIRDGLTSVLLDCGGVLSFDLAQEVDIPFLRKEKIYKLDCLIASHSDYDHIGAKDSLMSKFSVQKFVTSKEEFPLTIGNLTFVNYNVYSGENANEKSLVLSLDFMGKTFLFTGDADKNIEKQIIRDNPNLKADILKLGHHGSKTSSCKEFLEQISPEACVISVGKNNKYGHPDKEVIKRLNELGLNYRRTDEEGTITYRRYFHQPLGDL